MSVSATTSIRRLPRESRPSTREPLKLRLLEWGVAIPVVGFLIANLAREWPNLRSDLPEILLWLAVVVAADLMPVRLWSSVVLTMSLPVLLAAGMVYLPYEVGIIAFLGSLDPRELRRRIGLGRAVHNRAQVALSVMAASWVFHQLGGDPADWPRALLAGTGALAADFSVNAVMVALPVRIVTGLQLRDVLHRIHGDSPLGHAVGYVCLGVTATLLAAVFVTVGTWGLAAFLAPLVLARQMFSHARNIDRATKSIAARNRSIRQLVNSVVTERRDERLTVAADLHDEVLQPLYKVHLMGQVLRRDLETGRLLQLDEDLPELLHAAEVAQDAIRGIVRDLRRSSLGPGGLTTTLVLLVRELQSQCSAPIELDAGDVGGSPLAQLVLYQVAREALQNAIRYSNAAKVRVELKRHGESLRLLVEDDGTGFEPDVIDADIHFGLSFMRHRIEAAGGTLVIDTALGGGTRVFASIPAEAA